MNNCTVKVPSSMSGETFTYLIQRIKEKFGKDAEVTRVDDDSLIGGFILITDGRIYDMSVASQLSLMKKHIRGD